MEASRDEVERALRLLGGEREDSNHRNFPVTVDGTFVGKASIGHSWTKLDTKRLGKVAAQIYLSARELYDVTRGNKDLDWYRQHLKDKGVP